MRKKYTRRNFFHQFALRFLAPLQVVFLAGSCNSSSKEDEEKNKIRKEGECDDLTGIAEKEIKKRQALNYVDQTPIPENSCENCALYIAPGKEGECGGCMLFEGPVSKEGYCVQYQPSS